ncbi:LPXTG-motif cell wall anchor domain-containing protein [Gracilibacillus orientalis]|uniref:LPXTG-motif cell wall anchor domain-containing protein n=1 Tax=Gracilibacillus orientalis TaxID=334253 RepID=A0A1I4P9Q7_9BACI|nr:immunoglobulin-like domain-containing protein [Gracilibacillus orientalis]SFM24306.1 LPXTG-motif cell wall anchor domain-containing protein [Gracilibacillus orientalis]
MKNNRNISLLIILLLFQVIVGSIPITVIAEAVETNQESNPLVHYDMKQSEEVEGKTIFENLSDDEFEGIYQNEDKGRLLANEEVGFVALNGGSAGDNNAFIEIPKSGDGSDVLSDLENVTVTTLVNWTNDGVNRWIYGFGKIDDDIANGNSYLFTTPQHGNSNTAASGISEAGWQKEALITTSEAMSANNWNVVTSVFNGAEDTLTLFINGDEVAQGSTNGLQLANIIDSKASFSGFIGRSIFQDDDYFTGMVADFRIHGDALSSVEVANLSSELQAKKDPLNQLLLEDQREQLTIESMLHQGDNVEQVSHDLNLPTSGDNGVEITWDSSHPDVVAVDGTVQRPALEKGDTVVKLTATLSYQGVTTTKTFEVTVVKEFSDQERADLDAAAISIYNPDSVKGNLNLPTSGDNESEISWKSSHPSIIKGSDDIADQPYQLGWVDRPDADTEVTLTATVQYNDAITTKDFQVIVKKDPGDKEYDAYFFSYFTGEYEGGEEISFAVAEDPLHWRALNNGQSVIQSDMGERGLRDPFVIRAPEGDKFYMIATDLKMGESTNFDQAQMTGSHSIMVWESDDLVNWSEQRMVEVAPKNGGNTWAPEAFYHEPTGEYVVFWASSIPNEETYGDFSNGRPNGQYNVMYYATTRDFQTFSDPKVFIDDSFPTIDTTFIEHDDTFYRFTKSEANYKVYYEKAQDIFDDLDGIEENGFQFEEIAGTKDGNQGLIGHGGNNEGQTIFKAIDEEKWYLFLDSWPYHVRWTTDLEDGPQLVDNVLDPSDYALPPGPRHGTVIPITSEEYQALTNHYLPEGPDPTDDPVVHYSFDEEEDGVITDNSGNGYDATTQGNASIESEPSIGDSQGYIQLDGESGYVDMPKNLIQQENLEKMTISTWVKVDRNQADQRIFDFASDTGRTANRNSMYLSTQGDDGQLEFATVTPFTEKFANASSDLPSDYKYRLASSRLGLNNWQHVAVTIDGFQASLFVNGEEVSSNDTFNVEPRMLMETTMNYLGKSSRNNQAYFAGGFDEFKIYNRALSATEIKELADEVTVEVPEEPVSEALKEAMQSLVVHNIQDVRGHLTLPTKVAEIIDVTWESSLTDVITTTGEVTRPVHGEGDTDVMLIATLELDGEKLRKAFKAKVKELPEEQDYQGYVFPYFTGEGYENGEQVYFALSEGNNPLKWQQLNEGEPVFTSELGEEGLRDPFIIRSPEGDTFYMIATDLKIYGNGDWNRAQTQGSRSIMVWESNDLVNWSEQRMVEIAPQEAGNTWAPEIFYDDTTGEYIIFWASKLYEELNDRNNGNSYQRMMYTKTRDFYTFTEPEVYMDYGYSVIDTTMIEYDGKIYRFTKDERGNHPENSPNGKFIFQEVGDSVLDPNFEMIKEGVGKGHISQGEGPAIFKSNAEEKWYLFIDEFGGRGYVPFETTDLDSGEWTIPEEYDLPDRPRHGTVLPITAKEYQALSQQIPQEQEEVADEITSISLVEKDITLPVNETKQLSVEVTPDQSIELLWASNNEEVVKVDSDGKVTAVSTGEAFVTVSTAEGLHTDVARVLVTEQDVEEPSNKLEIEKQAEVKAGETYYLQGTKVSIKMPDDLPEGSLLTIKEVDEEALASDQNVAIAGEVFDFEMVYPEGTEEPNDPFGLTLGIDEMSQEPTISIYYYNRSQQKWEKQESDMHVEAGTVTSKVSHFSIYGVLETTEQQSEKPDEDHKERPSQPSDNDKDTPSPDGQQSGNNDEGGKQQQNSDLQKDQDKELPNTANMLFNWILLGVILLSIGLGLYFKRKRSVS